MAAVGQLRGGDICDQGGGIGEWVAWDLQYGNESWLTIRVVFTAAGVHYQQLGGLWHQIRSVRFYLPAGPELDHPPLSNLATDLCDILDATEAPAKKNLRVAGHRRCFIQPPTSPTRILSVHSRLGSRYPLQNSWRTWWAGWDEYNICWSFGVPGWKHCAAFIFSFLSSIRSRNKETRAVGPLEVYLRTQFEMRSCGIEDICV